MLSAQHVAVIRDSPELFRADPQFVARALQHERKCFNCESRVKYEYITSFFSSMVVNLCSDIV